MFYTLNYLRLFNTTNNTLSEDISLEKKSNTTNAFKSLLYLLLFRQGLTTIACLLTIVNNCQPLHAYLNVLKVLWLPKCNYIMSRIYLKEQ